MVDMIIAVSAAFTVAFVPILIIHFSRRKDRDV
jgi:hypothetical protein